MQIKSKRQQSHSQRIHSDLLYKAVLLCYISVVFPYDSAYFTHSRLTYIFIYVFILYKEPHFV